MFLPYLKAVLGRRAALAFGAAVCLGLLAGALEVATAYCFRFLVLILDDSENSRDYLGLFCFLLAGLGTTRSGVQFFLSQTANIGAELVSVRSRLLLSYHVLNSRHLTILAPSRIHHLFNAGMLGSTSYVRALTEFIVQLNLILVLAAALVRLAWREALLSFALTLIAGSGYLLILRKLKGRAHSLSELQQATHRNFTRINRNWISIRILQQQQPEYNRLFQSMVSYSNGLLRLSAMNTLNAAGPSVVGTAMFSVIIFTTVRYFGGNIETILPFVLLLVRLLSNCSLAYSGLAGLTVHRPYFEEMGRFILSLTPAERIEATRRLSQLRYFGMFGGDYSTGTSLVRVTQGDDRPPRVRLHNIGFTHAGSKEPLYSGVNLSLESGGHLGIVGPSGVGKSTLLFLLLGVTDPTEGNVEIDGLAPVDYMKLHPGTIGYLGADSVLDDCTIRENLLFGISHPVSDEDMRQAMKAVKLDHLVSRSQEGLDLRISDMTVRLSSGEKQRLAFAHILLQQPRLLVLDEPTANLDTLSETLILGLIKAMSKCTVVTVSHRPIFDPRQQVLDLAQHRQPLLKGA